MYATCINHSVMLWSFINIQNKQSLFGQTEENLPYHSSPLNAKWKGHRKVVYSRTVKSYHIIYRNSSLKIRSIVNGKKHDVGNIISHAECFKLRKNQCSFQISMTSAAVDVLSRILPSWWLLLFVVFPSGSILAWENVCIVMQSSKRNR